MKDKKSEDKKEFSKKFKVDDDFFKMVESAVKEGDIGKIDKLERKVEELLKQKDQGLKPSLCYFPLGKTDEDTTIKVALKKDNESVIELLLRYAKEIGANTEIFKQLKHAREQQENSQPKSDISNVSVSGNLTQAQGFKLGGA